MVNSEADPLKKAIVCSPNIEYSRVGDLEVHNIGEKADLETARQQHKHLVSILANYGCELVQPAELAGHPNSVFTRDTAVCTPLGYIRLRMGLPSRKGEEEWMAGILDDLGEPVVDRISAPATAEGGDIILAGKVVFIGHSSRTNQEGVRQLTAIFDEMNYEVRTALVPAPYLHIGGAMSVIGNNRVLCCKDVFPVNFFAGFETIEIPAGSFISGNVITLGNNEVIAGSSNTQAILQLEKAGITVYKLDLSEFVKGTGGPSCLVMPLERESITR